MQFINPLLPPYDAAAWRKLPFLPRCQQVCRSWAMDGYGTPLVVMAAYGLKIAAYIAGWVFFCSFSPALGDWSNLSEWWLSPQAFQKAVLWSMLFEVLGLGCGSGPLTGRYLPPIGGFLYFLRPGTTKIPLFGRLPLFGGIRRTWFDVLIYAALLAALFQVLLAPQVTASMVAPVVLLTVIATLCDRTIFLAARSEHYWVTAVCFVFAADWIAGAKAVQLALWFWAGMSKLNHHFPTVVCVMTSNSPILGFPWLRRRMYRDFPRDLRPSRLAVIMGHMGTALELAVPIVLAFAVDGPWLIFGMVLMLFLHFYITANIPMGVPLEWNFMVVYGAFFLFYDHPEASVLALIVNEPGIGLFLIAALIVTPLFGNLFPHRVSFLLSMRYYAGNWPFTVWMFKGDSYRKLDRHITKSSGWVIDQLSKIYGEAVAIALVGKVLAFRAMHLHGRILQDVLPRAVDDFREYEFIDGELVAGMVLGWNFGDGHLHSERLLAAVQAQCNFAPGELRCIFVESQPLHKRTLHYRIYDAAEGRLDEGHADTRVLMNHQPWGPSVSD
ncbi:MAG: DUF3556 domain-containing protein [Myxococcota bacterium]